MDEEIINENLSKTCKSSRYKCWLWFMGIRLLLQGNVAQLGKENLILGSTNKQAAEPSNLDPDMGLDPNRLVSYPSTYSSIYWIFIMYGPWKKRERIREKEKIIDTTQLLQPKQPESLKGSGVSIVVSVKAKESEPRVKSVMTLGLRYSRWTYALYTISLLGPAGKS